jgi:hypothetical protein
MTEEQHAFVSLFPDPSSAIKQALVSFMTSKIKGYHNGFTYAVAITLARSPNWQALAKGCDSWQELREKLKEAGIHKLPSGLWLDDRRISWKILTMLIRDKYA